MRLITKLGIYLHCLPLFTIQSLIYFLLFYKAKGYKKKFDVTFDQMLENGKLDKVVKEVLGKNSSPFLTLAHGNVYSTAFVFSYLKKNYPLLLD